MHPKNLKNKINNFEVNRRVKLAVVESVLNLKQAS